MAAGDLSRLLALEDIRDEIDAFAVEAFRVARW